MPAGVRTQSAKCKTGQLVERDFDLFVLCFSLEKMEVSQLVRSYRTFLNFLER
jgi:hypothetical protein